MSLSTPDSAALPWAFAVYVGLGLPILGWLGVSKAWAVLFITVGVLLVVVNGFRAYEAGAMVVIYKDRHRRARLYIASSVFTVLALAALAWW